jgi:hypothetical protein
MNREEIAVNYKHSGNNCCQAVVKALADITESDADYLSVIGSGFGAGMGCMEATCGALVGAIIVASIAKNGMGTAPISKEILGKFRSFCGAVTCKDLKGRDTGVVLCNCDDCVRNAVKAYCEVMDNI